MIRKYLLLRYTKFTTSSDAVIRFLKNVIKQIPNDHDSKTYNKH